MTDTIAALIDDDIRTPTLTKADAATNDSRRIAEKVDIHLARASRMPCAELLAAAEAIDRRLEAVFSTGDLLGALALGRPLQDLALRIACGTPRGYADVERRIRLLYAIRKALPKDAALRTVLDVVIEADCREWDIVVEDRDDGTPRLH